MNNNIVNTAKIIELINILEEEYNYNFSFEEKCNELYVEFNNSGYNMTLNDVRDFIYWFLAIKGIIISEYRKLNKMPINFNNVFNTYKSGYIGEGCYNITFDYNGLFAVKIPKVELYMLFENINNIHEYTNKFESVYGIFQERDILDENVSNNIFDEYDIFTKIKNEYIILPDFIDENLFFGIYKLGHSIDLDSNNEIITYGKKLKNLDLFNFLLKINKDNKLSAKYVDVTDGLDFKKEHLLIIDNEIKYCDIDENTIISFINLLKILNSIIDDFIKK